MAPVKKTPGWLAGILCLSAAPALAGEAVINGGFEEGKENWTVQAHQKPEGAVGVRSDTARSGANSLGLENRTGLAPFHYVIISQKLENLDPSGRYLLTFWGKGQISGTKNRFGVCDDGHGNEGFSYAEVGPSEDWIQYQVSFKPDKEGRKNVVFISADLIEGYFIDDVSVREE